MTVIDSVPSRSNDWVLQATPRQGQLQRLLTPDKRANTSMGPTYFVKVFEGDASLLPFAINKQRAEAIRSRRSVPQLAARSSIPDARARLHEYAVD